MQIRKNSISIILPVLLICMMFYAACTTSYAQDIPNLSHSGSISITLYYGDEPVSGGNLVCYRAGDVEENNGSYDFKLTADFSGSRVPIDDIFSADTAEKLAQWTQKDNLSGKSAKIDDQGHTVFTGLKPGLYLLEQDKASKKYYGVEPFLVSVPMNENGTYIYDVEASPKVELAGSSEPDTPVKPEDPTKPNEPKDPIKPNESKDPAKSRDSVLPQTGQLNWPVPIMCVSGLMLLTVGLLLRTNKKKNENER